jgi:hypothetical protein
MWLDSQSLNFRINQFIIYLHSEEMSWGKNTVAEIDNKVFYLGDVVPNINNAILAFQELNNVKLTNDELKQVLIDNNQ